MDIPVWHFQMLLPKKKMDIKMVKVGHVRLNDRRRESLLKISASGMAMGSLPGPAGLRECNFSV